ncbi:BnaCnng62940D, partial [Brassica napus]
MQRTLSLAAAKSSSSTSPLSLRPLMAKLQCRAIQSLPASSSSSVVSVYRNVCQLHFKRENASCFKLACALPSIGSVSYTAHFSGSSLSSFGNSFRLFPGRYFSQVPNTGNKDKVVKKFSKNWNNKNKKKNEVLASSEAEVVTATEPVIGDVSSGIKVDLAAAPVSSGKQASAVKPKRRPKKKKVEDKDKSSSTVSALEEVSVEESLKTVPKTKHSGSGNRKSSSAKKEVAKYPKSSAPTEASNAPKQEKVLASSELSTEAS